MPGEDAREAVADGLDVLEGEVAAVELAVLDLVHDDLADEVLEPRGGGPLERARGGLDRVGEHDHRGLLGRGRLARIGEIVSSTSPPAFLAWS